MAESNVHKENKMGTEKMRTSAVFIVINFHQRPEDLLTHRKVNDEIPLLNCCNICSFVTACYRTVTTS